MSGDRFHRELMPAPLDFYQDQGLTLVGKGKWRTTSCTFHGGSDSLRINVASGGYLCMACGAKGGDIVAYLMAANDLDFVSAAQQLGAWVDDPNGSPATDTSQPRRMPASDALGVIAVECTLIVIAAGNIAHGVKLPAADLTRVMEASNRVTRIQELFS